MVHRLRALGLTLVAILAIGALSSSSLASAAEFYSTEEVTELEANQEGVHEIVTNTGVIVCEVVHFTGEQTGSVAETMTLSPSYTGCEFEELFSVSVAVNGCDYVFHAETQTEGTMDIAGCGGSVPYIQWGSLATCRVRIQEQSGVIGIFFDFHFSPLRFTKFTFGISALNYSESGLFCVGGSVNNGGYVGASPVTGNGGSAELWIE